MGKELKDVVDKVIDLREVLYPKDKSKCYHVVLGELFFKIDNGCTMQCDNCGTLVENKCDSCSIGATLKVKSTGELITVLACDAVKMKKEHPEEYE